MLNFLSQIHKPFQKIIDQYAEMEIPQDILVPLIELADFEKLCLTASNAFSNLDLIISVPSNVYVVGDLHGNILDLLRILQKVGDISSNRILFLGDYVDRGEFSIEVITLLFCLACLYPENVFLIRGNHEFRNVNENYGFKQQIVKEFDSISPWLKANQAFDFLPIAALIDDKIFCVHGGISQHLTSVQALKGEFQKPIYSYDDPVLFDLMWSDPTIKTRDFTPSERGAGNQYGSKALTTFLTENNLSYLIRAHESIVNGIERMFKNKLITVFSSSYYGNNPKGKAGFIFINSSLEQEDFILDPYDRSITREEAHFIPIRIRHLNPTHLSNMNSIKSCLALSSLISNRSQSCNKFANLPATKKKSLSILSMNTDSSPLVKGSPLLSKPIIKPKITSKVKL